MFESVALHLAFMNHRNTLYGLCFILSGWVMLSCKKEESNEALPVLTTETVYGVARTSAWSRGAILQPGSDTILDHGFCWSTGMDPTLADQHESSDYFWEGALQSYITGLEPNTAYFIRAYATHPAGTGYGNIVTFTTKPATAYVQFNVDLSYDSIADIEGNVYKTISIGGQVWMAENLKTTQFNDGTPIPLINESSAWMNLNTPGYGWYENNEAVFKNLYGAYYNWYAVINGNLCPSGWHVPTDEEWKTLEIFLGMSQEQADIAGYRGNQEGAKIKETGTYNWVQESETGTNESGFTALPGGSTSGGEGSIGIWWSATEVEPSPYSLVWCRWVFWDASWIARSEFNKSDGLNVRCIKD